VGGAKLLEIDAVALDQDFGLDLAEAYRANGIGEFVKEIRAVGHGQLVINTVGIGSIPEAADILNGGNGRGY
jgi:hypothetical protein